MYVSGHINLCFALLLVSFLDGFSVGAHCHMKYGCLCFNVLTMLGFVLPACQYLKCQSFRTWPSCAFIQLCTCKHLTIFLRMVIYTYRWLVPSLVQTSNSFCWCEDYTMFKLGLLLWKLSCQCGVHSKLCMHKCKICWGCTENVVLDVHEQ